MSNLPVFRLPITSKLSVLEIMPTFEDCLGTFTVNMPVEAPTRSPIVAAGAPHVETIDPATFKRHGSITHDRETRRPTHEWNSLEDFHAWRINEELEHGIELLLSNSSRRPSCSSSDAGGGSPALWHEHRTYSCSRQGTGGKHNYVRKRVDGVRKRPSKRTGCGCRVRIKTYHHVSTVLGWYESEHDHAIGVANLMYTRLRDSTRAHVLNLLRMNMSPKEVFTRVRHAHGRHERGHYITMQDIYRLRKIVKQEEAARSMSSDGDQSNYEHSECSPKIEEDEKPTIQPEDISETGSATEVDEVLDVLDEQSDGYAEPGIFTSPPPGSAHPGMEFAASPAVPAVSTETTVPPASSMAPAISPVVPAASMESTALSVVPPATHYSTPPPPPPPPPVPPPHNTPGSWFMPPPVVVNIPNPPYQMTLYPLYPVYLPQPTH